MIGGVAGELVDAVPGRGHGYGLDAEPGAAEHVGRAVADDRDLLAAEAPAAELLGAAHGHSRQFRPRTGVGAVRADGEARPEAGRRELHPGARLDVAGEKPQEYAPVGGQHRDQLADAGQHLDVALGDLTGEQLHVALEAASQQTVPPRIAGRERGRVRAPQRRQVALDLGVCAPVEAVVAQLALEAEDLLDGAEHCAPAGAVRVDQRAVDVEEGEALHGSAVETARARPREPWLSPWLGAAQVSVQSPLGGLPPWHGQPGLWPNPPW